MPTWFERLTGFPETTWTASRAGLVLEGGRLKSLVNGRSWAVGTLETPSLAELRERTQAHAPRAAGKLRVGTLVADARALHARPEAEGALVQVASQFNLLEMVGPNVTPEHGVGLYENDRTQGPACAIAAGAATVYRNYFADTGRGEGQTRDRQIDTLKDLGEALAPGGIPMRNGYALPASDTLRAVVARLRASDDGELDRLRGLLRIGLHRDVEVTEPGPGCGQRLSQAFCSALPVAYSRIGAAQWEPFARLVLEAAYEATLRAAIDNAARGGSNTVFLTMLGGGAFGNDPQWILDAMRRALDLTAGHDLDVRVVSFGHTPLALERLADAFRPTRVAGAPDHAAAPGFPASGAPSTRADPLGASPSSASPSGVQRRAPAPHPAEETALAGRSAFDHDGNVAPRPHGNCYWLARGRVLAGEYPRTPHADSTRARLESLLDADVRRFVDLTEVGEGLAPYAPMLADLAAARGVRVTHVRHAIRDLDVPSALEMRRILDTLRTPHDGVTYFHCWGGVGRTGTVAACLLIEAGFSAKEAIALIDRKWQSMDKRQRKPQSPETPAQFAFIRQWKRGHPMSPAVTRSAAGPHETHQAEPERAQDKVNEKTSDKAAPCDLLVVFSHGKESGPNGRKIEALRRVAEAAGAHTISVNYREHPAGVPHDHDLPGEPDRRVRQLLSTALPKARRLVLVGSSMGGYVSTVAASTLRPDGLFLLAPAFHLPGYAVALPETTVPDIAIVHGWGDDVVPWQNSERFARQHRCTLHLIDADHRLDGAIPLLERLFGMFLERVTAR